MSFVVYRYRGEVGFCGKANPRDKGYLTGVSSENAATGYKGDPTTHYSVDRSKAMIFEDEKALIAELKKCHGNSSCPHFTRSRFDACQGNPGKGLAVYRLCHFCGRLMASNSCAALSGIYHLNRQLTFACHGFANHQERRNHGKPSPDRAGPMVCTTGRIRYEAFQIFDAGKPMADRS